MLYEANHFYSLSSQVLPVGLLDTYSFHLCSQTNPTTSVYICREINFLHQFVKRPILLFFFPLDYSRLIFDLFSPLGMLAERAILIIFYVEFEFAISIVSVVSEIINKLGECVRQ